MEESIRRANAYKFYREDPTFREPWDKVRSAFVARWQTTNSADVETRETIFKYLGLMDKLDQFVSATIASGEIDQARFEALLKHRESVDSNQID